MTEERFSFTSGARKTLMIIGIVGVLLVVLGAVVTALTSHGHGGDEHALIESTDNLTASTTPPQEMTSHQDVEEGEEETHRGSPTWLKRIFSNLWLNNVYFLGIGIMGLFFIAIEYATQAGWSVGMNRVALAIARWIPIAGILMLVSWFIVKTDVFHWTHADLYHGEHADEVLQGKSGYWYWPFEAGSFPFPFFYIFRMVLFLGLWYMFFLWIKKEMLEEDIDGNVTHWYKARKYSAIFLVIFAVSSSIASWDWIMSVDPHWFSTMFGWYIFASWWVNGLAVIALIVVVLKEQGYLQVVNANHLHDIGKFIFGFSIFWTYIWFSQFLLYYYANIPEETVYFIERMDTQYSWVFYINLILNFFLPFLLLMTRASKRHLALLKLVCPIVIAGHWFDFYLMITPGVMKQNGGFGFIEIGMVMIFGVAFLFVTFTNLARVPLFGKNHPMLKESLHHHI